MLLTIGKDTVSKVDDYSLEDCPACQTTIRLTPTSVSFSRDTACAYCPLSSQFLRTTDTFEGRLLVKSLSHEDQLSVTQALGTIATFSLIFLPPRRRIVPPKQRMAGRLGVSRSEFSLQISQTLGNLAKERRMTRSSWRFLGTIALSWSLETVFKFTQVAWAKWPPTPKKTHVTYLNFGRQLRGVVYFVSPSSPIRAW